MGITIITEPFTLIHHQTSNPIVCIEVLVNAGSTSEKKEGDYGVAHFLEHMAFKGTKNKTYKEVNDITSKLGITNAYTSGSKTCFHINCIDGDFDKAVDILMEIFLEPRFDPEEFEKERGVILEEIQTMRDSPTSFFWDELRANLFGKTGHCIAGSKEGIEKMPLNSLKDFRSKFYGDIAFIVVGNIDIDHVTQKFYSFKDRLTSQKNEESVNPLLDMNEFHFHHKSKQAIIGLITPGITSLQICDDPIQSVVINALGGGMHSLLFDRIREELGLCYSVSTFGYCFRTKGAVISFSMLDKQNIEKAKDEMVKIIGRLSKEGIPSNLLETSKKNYLFDIANDTQTSGGYASTFLDGYFMYGNRVVDFEKEKEFVPKITNEDIIKFATEYFGKMKFVSMTED